jgi:hypothetical protein
MAQVKKWEAKVSHKVIHTIVTIVVTLALVGGGAYAYIFFKNDTKATTQNNPGKVISSTVKANPTGTAHFDEAGFAFDLPADWKKTDELTTGPYHKFTYWATLKNADNRHLDIYADSLPLQMPVNKEVSVQANGTKLTHGEVSNNCAEFTTQTTPKKLQVPAKWDGVDFLCDMDGVTRNIVGTSSPGNINSVTLTNVGFTKHSFFFVYEDDNYNPDYGIMYNMLNSFQVK